MGALYIETGGMKRNAPAAVKLEAYFSVLLHTKLHVLDGLTDWVRQWAPVSGSLMFNKEAGLNKVKEDSVLEAVSVTCFPQLYPTKDSLCNL